MITKWRNATLLEPPVLISLLPEFPSLSRLDQIAKLREIRLMTSGLPSFRPLLTNVSPLLTPFMIKRYSYDVQMHNDVLTTILNISTVDRNKEKIVLDSPRLISFLITALGSQNSVDNRSLAAAALCELSGVDVNKAKIGRSGAVGPLIELLAIGHPLASREAAGAVLRLCSLAENKMQAFSLGGLDVVLNKLDNLELLDMVLEILALFSGHSWAVDVMVDWGIVPRLFRVIRVTKSGRDEANSLATLLAIGSSCKTRLRMIANVENEMNILGHVAENESSEGRNIALDLLLRIRGIGLPNVNTKIPPEPGNLQS